MNLFEMKQNLFNIGQQIKTVNEKITAKSASPDPAAVEDIKELNKTAEGLQVRFDALKKQTDAEELKQKTHLKKNPAKPAEKREDRIIQAEAAWIRHTMRPDNADFSQKLTEARQALQDDATTNGSDFLPINVSNQLISEPFATNPLRQIETVSTITNLVLPRIGFDIEDDSFISDGDTAKEIDLKGDQVTFGRNQVKVRAGISDTVLYGSDTALVEYTNNLLSSALQLKERNMALGTNLAANLAHMSFYDTTSVKIDSVTGDSLYDAILSALGDLDDAFQDNAKVLMRRSDYYAMIKALANGSSSLYAAQPEQVIGVPVQFTSAAVTPIVGDFSYAQLNYDIHGALYEQYKDYQKGINYFQLTAWFDHQIKLASAFRLATVSGTTTTTTSK
ncbi:phage major capsid protein [Liquorilactobacillus nagelii]|jgi:HK97 family phage major capsid protein|uniref:phage major capsid protein n=1 Tax=Liquorilactobacillus nagelii TaxID=82688 RepID=UPI00242F78B2|nr:phage major capsid protein [Liquorilactobacillus nagelii]MCI1699998.1 phage major capsid protein [Liquorilactobacillus nagelii]